MVKPGLPIRIRMDQPYFGKSDPYPHPHPLDLDPYHIQNSEAVEAQNGVITL
jgi:hypothetical protein